MSSSTIVEIRPGEGGSDAETFAAELATAFAAYARRHRITARIEAGRTITVTVDGPPSRLRLDRFAGVHRIQRIPRSERSGRRHTSTATVAVLDAAAAAPAVELHDDDLDIQTKRGSGKGGQHRNVTDSAVRLTHRPTGMVVEVNHGRSQWQNIAAAKAELARRLAQEASIEAAAGRNATRVDQIASGERPVKAFTWNDQRAEVIDHATGVRYPLAAFLRDRLDQAS